jgi:hypothetical protein
MTANRPIVQMGTVSGKPSPIALTKNSQENRQGNLGAFASVRDAWPACPCFYGIYISNSNLSFCN